MNKGSKSSPSEPQSYQNTNPDDHFAGAGKVIEVSQNGKGLTKVSIDYI